MATPKADRTPPDAIATQYIVTRTKDPLGLLPIADSNMKLLSGGSDLVGSGDAINQGDSLEAWSLTRPIGFTFNLDGIDYKNFFAGSNGWMILAQPDIDPTDTVTLLSGCFLSGGMNTNENENIGYTSMSGSALLCPWFDALRSVTNRTDTLSVLNSETEQRILWGLDNVPKAYNETRWGVRYLTQDSEQGRRLIVRWNAVSSQGITGTTYDGSVLSFEAVIYENGKIEYRYPSRKTINVDETVTEGATVGLFPSGSRRFRDLSLDLGYVSPTAGKQATHALGGGAWFTDDFDTSSGDTRGYAINMNVVEHWPGFNDAGCVFTFIPPSLQRRVLPRRELIKHDSRRTRVGYQAFDDQRTLNFLTASISSSGVILVGYPTTLPRFVGGFDPSVITRQDLFANDFFVTSSTSPNAMGMFIEPAEEARTHDSAFSEASRADQGPSAAEDAFFVSGSIELLGEPTRSKRRVRFSIPVNYPTTMPPLSSSILYLNAKQGRWVIPDSMVADLADPKARRVDQLYYYDDHRGFGPIGNVVVSGTIEPSLSYNGDSSLSASARTLTEDNIRKSLYESSDPETGGGARFSDFSKTVTNNSDYDADASLLFEIPITEDFVIEKAIFELPIAAGPGWFNDTTRTFLPITDTKTIREQVQSDFAGPALTVALFSQVTVGGVSTRELIMTGTITHLSDLKSELVMRADPPLSESIIIYPEGFLAYASQPGAVITPDSANTFTGSVEVRSEATIASGPVIILEKDLPWTIAGYSEEQARAALLQLLALEELPLRASSWVTDPLDADALKMLIAYASGLGRGRRGLEVSGRSPYGKEFVTFQSDTNPIMKGRLTNPFHLTTASIQGQYQSQVDASFPNTGTGWYLRAMQNLASHFRSPYLVRPGDRLILAVSKTRPGVYYVGNSTGSISNTSGSISHDIRLMSGSVNVTLYGSVLAEDRVLGSRFDITATDSIHDVYGQASVIDQYDVPALSTLSGSYTDIIATGSLATKIRTKAGTQVILTASRGAVTSKIASRGTPAAETTSWSYDLQPWFERAGSPRLNSATDGSERYWDSLAPGIADIFSVDDKPLFIPDFSDPPTTNQLFYPRGNWPSTGSLGWAMMGFNNSVVASVNNKLWPKAYPFEPRYVHLARQTDISKGFIISHTHDLTGELSTIDPITVQGLIIYTHQFFLEPTYADRISASDGGDFIYAIDNNPSTGISGSLSLGDTARWMFGFGDLNSTSLSLGGCGSNHVPFHRQMIVATLSGHPIIYATGPIIRGWKYGLVSGMPTHSRAYFRRDRYGQFRDMLEQRPMTRWYRTRDPLNPNRSSRAGVETAAINVKFIDAQGNITAPENTTSSNLSLEATSSLPFLDGVLRNRTEINTSTQNTALISFGAGGLI